MLVVGVSQLRGMPVDVLPEYLPTTVEVQTEALGLSAAEVEQLITVPLEQDLLNGVAFLDELRSDSVAGLSRILLVFEPGTDLFKARQVVAERLTQAHALPHVSKPPLMLQPLSSTNRVLTIGASSQSLSAIEMGVLARWTIVPRLLGVAGVANVSVWGQRDRQLQIQVDPEHLRGSGVSLLQVVETAGNALWSSPLSFVEASTPGTGGFIDTPNQRLGVQHFSPISTAADLARVSLQGTGAKRLQVGDVASVVEDHQPLIGDAVLGGGGEAGLLFVVEKLPGASVLEVTRGVEAAIDALRPGFAGVEFDTGVYRPASYLERSIGNLGLVLLVGAILVALVLGGFYFRWRTALIGIVTIPLSLVAAALVLWALGTTMNAIVLAGLVAALALVIDDAIIGVEHVARRLRERRQEDDRSSAALILEASLEMRGASFYATAIIALAVLPLFFLEGLAGAFFPDLVGAYLLALLASLLVALTVTPALSLLLFSRASFAGGQSPLARLLQRGYARALASVVQRPRGAYLAAAAVLVAACAAAPFLSSGLLPSFKEQQLLIQWDGPPGTSLPEMNRITARASRELRSLPGVERVGAHVGRAVASDQSVGANAAELWVSIDPQADYEATLASIRAVVDGYPGLARGVDSFANERSRAVLSEAKQDLVVRLYGEDAEVLQREAARLQGTLAAIEGIAQPRLLLPALEPTLEIEVDLAAARAHGIKPGDVRRAAAVLLSGIHVGSLFEQQKVFDVVVWGTPATRSNLSSIRQLLIDTPAGGHVRLGQVADVRIAPQPAVIKRQGVSRYLDVAAQVSGRDRGAVVQEIKRRLAEVRFPLEYHAEVLAAQGQPLGRLLGLALAALVGIFLLLQACFGSWRLATLSLLSLPLALAGGVLAALAAGGRLSFGSLIGLLALLGLAVRNGLLLIDRYRRLQRQGQPFGRELVLEGARERSLPIVMTAAASLLALLPVLLIGTSPGYELLHPLAVVLLGGLLTSTLLNLFLLPPLYLRFGHSPEPAYDELTAAGERKPELAIARELVLRQTETGLDSAS